MVEDSNVATCRPSGLGRHEDEAIHMVSAVLGRSEWDDVTLESPREAHVYVRKQQPERGDYV